MDIAADRKQQRADMLVQACDGDLSEALVLACINGEAEMVAYLIQHLGANVEEVRTEGLFCTLPCLMVALRWRGCL